MTKTTPGFEQFDHLMDKSNLLLFLMEDEAREISDLQNSIIALKRERREVKKVNEDLNLRIDSLSEKQSEIDLKAGILLKALDKVRFS